VNFTDVEHDRSDLHAYQRDIAIPFLLANPFSALFADVGLGKCISVLTVLVELLDSFDNDDKILIIGPMRVACETWPTEISLWRHTAHLTHSLIHVSDTDLRLMGVPAEGVPAEKDRLRREAVRSRSTIHIIPFHHLEWLVELLGRDWPYRIVIVDESSGFKDHNSKRFLALAKIRNSAGLITRMHLLTATPAAESYIALFPQMFLLDRGERLGKMITHYRDRYFTFNPYKRKYFLRPGGEDDLLDKIKDLCLVMKADDYLSLEKPTVLRRLVHLEDRELKLYKKMEKDFIVTLDDGSQVEAETAAVLSQKLLQLASGVLYETTLTANADGGTFAKRTKAHHIHDHKIEELRQIVDELQGSPLLVGYHFKSSLDRLQKAFPTAVAMDTEGKCVKPWNKGKIPILLMHPQAGGHGLNLQAGGHHVVFFDIPWSLELYLQFVGRVARQGQKHAVVVWLMTAVGTLDSIVCESLIAKEDAQDKLFTILKRMIARYRKSKAMDDTL